ncbi:AzlD domain-containing protein [Paracoccus aminophilus]|uniref:Branched-chain amino acid transporter AzlD n=1 Tax=Paracoccus aminophilus JCM 7686 TaxID=1367847 RepID=S5XQM3_PARAH|nr:AzlD domain-containing protein [Paracoccus aminophilus]AGT07367.1 branched-chain amino acid transporter AzlD [Paracoccus aminophilus JCM 7686]
MSDLQIWTVIIALGLGTYLIRWSFLGAIGHRPIPLWVERLLRYTAVGVLPAMIAPLVVWPAATAGAPDPARLTAAAVTLVVGVLSRNTLAAIVTGGATLFAMLAWIG